MLLHPSSRADVLALLNGQRVGRVPCFSGLISVTAPGLRSLGLRFSETHGDARKLAAAAASTYRRFGFESAVAPLDLCVEAEALGAAVDFRADVDEPMFPLVAAPLVSSAADFDVRRPGDILRRGRLPIVREALQLLRAGVGSEIVVGAFVPGPFTLAMQLVSPNQLLIDVARAPESIERMLAPLADLLVEVALSYRAAGADFLTVHEMGGSPGVVGPRAFETLVLPPLGKLFSALPRPRVLSVCGDTNRAIPQLAAAGAEALSVDQLNDLARTRAALGPGGLLFGNIDPVGVLAQGTPGIVRQAVSAALAAGADAIWPGCDLWPAIPTENMRAMMNAVS
jgi:[methyl-Co(III) methanol-specific corrinoid protein]:coenzyme M methyltransferase